MILKYEENFDFGIILSRHGLSKTSFRKKLIKLFYMSKHSLLVEDIIDTGHTLNQVIKLLNNRKPKSLEVCCLLNKFSRRETDVESKWVGFDIPDEFVVGYGIDYAQDNRHLPFIGKVVQE